MTPLHRLYEIANNGRITAASREYWLGDAPKWTGRSVPITFKLVAGEDELIGFSGCELTPTGTAHSITLVHPDYRKQGIGRLLMTQKIAAVKATGRIFTATVAEDNTPCVRLCQSIGTLAPGRPFTRIRESGEYTARNYSLVPRN